ncbi:MAG: hypothetical protein Q9168_006635 [Polycauliona sp. 1 TL-2023]
MEYSTSSSKVTVEYTDPSGIYPVISEDFQKHLPLRNLYWNSATRPLRSISSLHVELVPAGSPNPSLDSTNRVNSGGLNSAEENPDVSRDIRPGSGVGVKKGRRHQIPGLRQTPYLKIFFLRCSDVDAYRATYRKQIREWIDGNTPITRSTAPANTQEFHDAFEWLIVHVVLPDDGRSISRASATSKTEVRNGLGGSSAVTEKIRANFNGSSKAAVDRVSSIQITRAPHTGQKQVSSDGWEDFVTKAKSLILSSFDLRVTQYEEDIKEREAQSNIPGWNFNTFFVLKEGLARGFESVGLVEDALTGYRELAVGLNSIIEGRGERDQHGEHFKDFTDDLSATLKTALQSGESQDRGTPNPATQAGQAVESRPVLGANILDADRKPFRELILANEISVFDFQCYLFARETSLLLRLANAVDSPNFDNGANGASVDVASSAASPESQNLLLLAEVCRRSIDFFSAAGRMIRDDLRSSVHPLSKGHITGSPATLSIFDGPIEDMVASWTYSACQRILDATNVPPLQIVLQPLLRSLKPTDEGHTANNNNPDSLPREELPRRTSSLPMSTYALSPDGIQSITSLDAVRLLPPASTQTGAQELAAERADLVILKRRVISSVGRRSTNASIKQASLAGPLPLSDSDMEDIPIDEILSVDNHTKELPATLPNGSLVQGKELSQSMQSEHAFSQAYEELTITALALNVIGSRRSRSQDYSSAASYFRQLSSFYHNNDWTRLEVPMLDLYAKCLKHLDRKQEFCRIGLQILSKTASRQSLLHTHADIKLHHAPDVGHYLQDVIDISSSLERPVSTPLHLHFEDTYLDPYIRHCENQDGFRMSLSLRNIMSAAVKAQDILVKLVSIEEEQRCELWMTSLGPELLRTGLNDVIIESTVMCPGWYRLASIEIRSANIVFTHDTTAPTNNTSFGNVPVSPSMLHSNSKSVFVWPDEKALDARLSLCKSIHLGKPRSIEILIYSGRNDISHGNVSVRACSAGLRLHTAETAIISGDCHILKKAQAGSIDFGGLDAQARTTLRVPYDTESDLAEIRIKLEVSYTVDGQGYQYNCTGELPIHLPLSVNVQDNFQERALFSNFKVDTAKPIPVRVGSYSMHSTKDFEVTLPTLGDTPLTIFPRQPLSLVAKIRQSRRGTANAQTTVSSDRLLMLRIKYACLDYEISTSVGKAMSEALSNSEFVGLSRLLVSELGKILRSTQSPQDLETIGLLGEIQLNCVKPNLWQPILHGIHPDKRDKVAQWLAKWQAVHSQNVLELMVPFEIPEIPVVVTGRLKTFGSGGGPGEGRYAAMDQSLLAELSLSYSRHWSKNTNLASEDNTVSITYEVQADPDAWLVGGQRKGHFTAKEGDLSRFPIILLPQKMGHLLYPSIEIGITKKAVKQGRLKGAEEEFDETVPCEVDYLDHGESILITPNLSSSTVSLESNGPGGGAWLVESKSRSET